MKMKRRKNRSNIVLAAVLVLLVVLVIEMGLLLADRFGIIDISKNGNDTNTTNEIIDSENNTKDDDGNLPSDNKEWVLTVSEDYDVMYNPNGDKGYRYGPSILKYEDGTMDMWMSRPGNNSTEWDYIAYRHYDGEYWSDEEVVLWPTSGSKDQCSVCDPAVIYLNGYYYLGYTATASYELDGLNNSAFVARSKSPNGPFEKWSGESWGGNPEPIIEYDHSPNYWGIGELSFVADEEDLFIYYTFINDVENCIRLAKADLSDNWPETVRLKGTVSYRKGEDSYDVVYAKDCKEYVAFSIRDRMLDSSYLVMYTSENGKDFVEVASVKNNIKDFAHNMGIAKNELGHIDLLGNQIIGYAYGKEWGSWPMLLQNLKIEKTH